MRQGLSNSDLKMNLFSDRNIKESITGTEYNVRISSAAFIPAFMIKLLKTRVKVIKGYELFLNLRLFIFKNRFKVTIYEHNPQ